MTTGYHVLHQGGAGRVCSLSIGITLGPLLTPSGGRPVRVRIRLSALPSVRRGLPIRPEVRRLFVTSTALILKHGSRRARAAALVGSAFGLPRSFPEDQRGMEGIAHVALRYPAARKEGRKEGVIVVVVVVVVNRW